MSDGTKIPFCRPFNSQVENAYVLDAVNSGWWTTGPKVKEFEEKFAEYTGAKYCVALNSCTAALFLSYQWYKKKYGIKKVLCPSLTFAATVTEIIHAGLEPVFGDVDPITMCLVDPIDTDYDAIATVHLTGNKAFTPTTVPVVEDSAHRIERGQCKNNPNLVCFSFYATKNLSMGEGGAICTNDEEAYNWFKQARHHGISKGGWDRYKEKANWQYDIEFIGWKFNLSDIHAAIGIAQLEKIDVMNANRARCIGEYNHHLRLNRTGLHLYPILVKDRTKFIDLMNENNIQCSVHFIPLHTMTAFENYKNIKLPITEKLGEHLVSLPLFPSLTNNEIEFICKTIKESNMLLLDSDLFPENI